MTASNEPKMTPSPDVLTAHLEGEAVLLDMETKRYYRLNDTAAAIWRGLEKGLTRTELRESLLQEYEIDGPALDAALDRMMAAFEERRLVIQQSP